MGRVGGGEIVRSSSNSSSCSNTGGWGEGNVRHDVAGNGLGKG